MQPFPLGYTPFHVRTRRNRQGRRYLAPCVWPDGGRKLNITVAIIVAAFKASLVALIFMHLAAEKRLIYRVLIFTGFFVLGLFWLTYLAWYDPITR